MTEEERLDLLKSMEKYKQMLSGNQKASREFLVRIGIYTEKGNLKKNYRNLCIQPDQV